MGEERLTKAVGRSREPRNRALKTLRRWFADSGLASGQFLPSEHELAASLNVSRSTLRLALQELEHEGLFETIQGKGRVITRLPAGQSLVARSAWVMSHFTAPAMLSECHTTGFSEFIQLGVIQALQAAGLHVTLLHPEHSTVQNLGGAGLPLGMILFPLATRYGTGAEIVKELDAARIPIVSFERPLWLPHYDAVIPDHESGCYELTRWLIARGCKRILRFWQWPLEDEEVRPTWLNDRDKGYERAVREAGLEIVPTVEARHWNKHAANENEFREQIRRTAGMFAEYLSGPAPVDGIMTGSDYATYSAAGACRLFHKTPQQDVAIVGYDNVWMDCPEREWEPSIPLATMDKFNLRLGEELVRLLQERIAGTLPPGPQTVFVKPKLVEIPLPSQSESSSRDSARFQRA